MYETANLFGRRGQRVIKLSMMDHVRREANLIGIERNVRLDELRQLLRTHTGSAHFEARKKWRGEMIALYGLPF